MSREGRRVVISADRRITRNKSEYHAFRSSRLIGFFLSAGLNKSPLTKQTERILALWNDMEVLAERVGGGAMFKLTKTSPRIKQLKLPCGRRVLALSRREKITLAPTEGL